MPIYASAMALLVLLMVWKSTSDAIQSATMPLVWIILIVAYTMCSSKISSSKREVFLTQYMRDSSSIKQKLRYGYIGKLFDTGIAAIFTLVFLVKVVTMSAHLVFLSYMMVVLLLLANEYTKNTTKRHVKPEYENIVTMRISISVFTAASSFLLILFFLASTQHNLHGINATSVIQESMEQVYVDNGFTLLVSIAVTIEHLQIWFVQNIFSGMTNYGLAEIILLIIMFSTYYIYSLTLIRLFYGSNIAQSGISKWRGGK